MFDGLTGCRCVECIRNRPDHLGTVTRRRPEPTPPAEHDHTATEETDR